MIRQLFAGLFLSAAATVAAACTETSVDLRGPFGTARFNIELADDPQERAVGLMNRDALPLSSGMLFIFDETQELSFWMRNTRIPLDMIFINEAGIVQHVHANAIPFDETPVRGGRGIAVLEINGGMAARMGIAPGAELRHPSFDPEIAAWSCAE